ncbi:MAG TPA: hypothetical protein VIB00_03735, partial [Pyrinomonadaceae bacterium]
MNRNLSRHTILVSSLTLVALSSVIALRTDALATHLSQGSIWTAACSSEMGGNVVYVSKIFDVVSPPFMTQIDTNPLNNAFKNYLVEEYDFKSNAAYSTGCRVFKDLSQAEANRRQITNQAQQANKQIVELKWNPGPIVAVSHGDGFIIGPKVPPPTHTICSIGYQNTTYFSAVFDTREYRPDPAWDNAFNNFLRKNYGAEGLANCTSMATVREATRLLHNRVVGLRVNNHKAVETGWKFDPTDLAANKPRPKSTPTPDADPEPVVPQRPAAQKAPPSQSIKDFAAQEGPQVLAYCQKDP